MKKIWTHDYEGFESILDFDEDWLDVIPTITPNGEYQGTIRITFEYIPSEDEVESELNEPNCG